jgi:hypothetical protein
MGAWRPGLKPISPLTLYFSQLGLAPDAKRPLVRDEAGLKSFHDGR